MTVPNFTLTQLRDRQNYSQQTMAEKLGTSIRQYQRYEKGDSKIPIGKLSMLALALDVTYDELLAAVALIEARDAREVRSWRGTRTNTA